MRLISKLLISLLLFLTVFRYIPVTVIRAENETEGDSITETADLETADPETEDPADEVPDNTQSEGNSEEENTEAGSPEDMQTAGAAMLLAASDDDPYEGWRTIFVGGKWIEQLLEPANLHPVEHGVVTVQNLTQGGSFTSSRTARVSGGAKEGDEIKVTVVPDADYVLSSTVIKGMYPEGESFDRDHYLDLHVTNNGDGTYSFTMPENIWYVVVIEPKFTYSPQYKVTVADTQNGTVTADKETARKGETVTLTVTPEENCELKSLTVTKESGEEVAYDADNHTFVMPAENVTVSAEFVRIWKVSVTVNEEDAGTAEASADSGENGDTITLTASPADPEKYRFKEWTVVSGGVTIADPESAETTFVIGDADVEVQAVFARIYTITVVIDADDGAEATAELDVTKAAEGDTITLTVEPGEHSKVTKVSNENDDLSVTKKSDTEYSFMMPAEDTVIHVKAEVLPVYTITYDLNGGTLSGKTGTITVEAEEGTTIKISAAPKKDGYTFTYWKGSEYHPGDSYKVTGDHTFTAQWKKAESAVTAGTAGSNDTKNTTRTVNITVPDTGDDNHLLLWEILLAASVLGLVLAICLERRYREER